MAPKRRKSKKKAATAPAVTPAAPAAAQPVRRDRTGRVWSPREQNIPKHTPTPETRAAVTALNALGKTQTEIAKYLTVMMKSPISKSGVGRYYGNECSVGLMHQQLMVSQNFFRKVVGSPAQYDENGNVIRAEVKTETVAQIFWLKCRAGWIDRQVVEHSGPKDAAPIVHKHEHTLKAKSALPDLSSMSEDDLTKLYRQTIATSP